MTNLTLAYKVRSYKHQDPRPRHLQRPDAPFRGR